MNTLVIGSGGREHALAWKLAQSPLVSRVFVAPGNGGTSRVAMNVPINPSQPAELIAFCRREHIELTVIGPDDALAAGLSDALQQAGLRVFGPTAEAARLESSKAFAKQFMLRHGIPTARSETFVSPTDALAFCDELGYPAVIKADGLALGKGVVIAQTREEAALTLDAMMHARQFGSAGSRVVVEQFLTGLECSVHALVDGRSYLALEPAEDHKQVFDGGRGPNTGGMGTVSPPASLTAATRTIIERDVLAPFARGIASAGPNFRGLLFPGLMLTPDGLRVLEFNARFGDPETQVLMRRLKSDLVPLLQAAIDGTLETTRPPEWDSRHAVCVVMASCGYPGAYKKGCLIHGVDVAESDPNIVVFHAGTVECAGEIRTNGGRVLGVTALGTTVEDARSAAYAAVAQISFEGAFWRSDIGAYRTTP